MGAFDTSDVSAQGASAVTPKAGVQDRSSLIAMEGVSNLLSFGLETSANIQAKKAQDAGNAAINSFAAQQLNISDAVAQGSISSTEGQRRMRVNSQKALAAGMSFDDMSSTQKAIVTTSGFGKVVAEGTVEEQQERKIAGEAFDNNFYSSSSTEADKALGIEAYLTRKRAEADIAFLSSQQSLKGAQFDYKVKTRVDAAKVAVGSLAQSEMDRLQIKGKDIIAQHNSGVDQAVLLQLINEEFAETEFQVQQVGAETGNVLEAVAKPILSYKQLLIDQVTGKISDEVRDRETKKLLSIQGHTMVQDPEIANAIKTAEYFRGVISVSPTMNKLAIRALTINGDVSKKKSADLVPESSDEELAVRDYLTNIKENITQVEASVDPKAFKAAMRIQTDSILKGVVDQRGNIQGAKSLNQVVEFLASPQYGTFTQANGGVDSGVAIEAKAVLDAQYEDVVLPLLKREFDDAVFTGTVAEGGTRGDLVAPIYSGSGVTFVAKEGVRLTAPSVDKLRRLNAFTGPMLNRLVRMSSHLAGHRNYKRVFDESYAGIFGEEQVNDNAE